MFVLGLPMVVGLGLSLEPSPSLLMGRASWLLKLAIHMAQAHVELAHVITSIPKKNLFKSNPFKKSYTLI